MVKLQRTKNNQYVVTINRKLIEAKGYARGDDFTWLFNSKGNLELIKKE